MTFVVEVTGIDSDETNGYVDIVETLLFDHYPSHADILVELSNIYGTVKAYDASDPSPVS